jgi:hypothetical protein
MVQMSPEEPPQQPVDELARLLMDAARADPTLLNRVQAFRQRGLGEHSAGLPATVRARQCATQIPSAPLVARSDTDEYLEQLVSLAVSSAQRAEDALRSVGGNNRVSRRMMAAAAGIGAVGVLIGIIGVADGRLIHRSDARLTQVVSEARVLADVQQQTSGQASQLRARAADQSADVGSTPRDAGAATSGGVLAQVADQHPGTGHQPTEQPVSDVAAVSSEATPALLAASPTQSYGFHPPVPAGPPASPSNVEPASSEGTSTPAVAARPVPALPMQPYGLHPVVLAGLPAPSADVPPPPGYPPRIVQHAAAKRRAAKSRGGVSSGNPVRDARNFIVAVGDGRAG